MRKYISCLWCEESFNAEVGMEDYFCKRCMGLLEMIEKKILNEFGLAIDLVSFITTELLRKSYSE